VGAGRVATVLGIAGLDGEVDIGQPCMMPALNVPNLDGEGGYIEKTLRSHQSAPFWGVEAVA